MKPVDGPSDVVWDLTYACPLRCIHCYSESGRRPSRQPSDEQMVRIADRIIDLRPDTVTLSGGEPFVVRHILDLADRFRRAGIGVYVYTSGWSPRPGTTDRMADVLTQVHVSLDGATAEVHDRVRGRAGSFDRAIAALTRLDRAAADRADRGLRPLRFGIDCVVLRSNISQLEEFCTAVVPRFPRLGFVVFGAVVPCGLATRESFGEHELLDEEQFRALGGEEVAGRLRALVPASVELTTTDNRALQMHPDLVRRGQVFRALLVEPDGEVRAMPAYEGTVGNILTDDPAALWQRAVSRWTDPFLVDALTGADTVRQWAEAARRIDFHYGSPEVRARIARRPQLRPLLPAGS